MSNISHKECSNAVRDLSESGIVKVSRITTGATEQDVRSELSNDTMKDIHIDDTCFSIDKVWLRLEVMTAGRNFLGLCLVSVS